VGGDSRWLEGIEWWEGMEDLNMMEGMEPNAQ
jgi:hypothetical protein